MTNCTTAILVMAAGLATAQEPATAGMPWQAQTSGVTAELRGLSVVSDKIAWASGSKGTILRTLDGVTWAVIAVPGAEGLDFRDIEAWDRDTAIALSIGSGESSNLFKTTDGGAHWTKIATNSDPQGFWDAIAFWDRDHGAVFGDPVAGRFFVSSTRDGGRTWTKAADSGMPKALEKEGAFAASGSCLAVGPDGRIAFVTGGASESRIFISKDRGESFHVAPAPVPSADGRGLFSVAWIDDGNLIAVGGDYRQRNLQGVNATRSSDGGATWTAVNAAPVGYLSSVISIGKRKDTFVAVGLAGTGISKDRGKTWRALDAAPYNTVAFTKDGKAGWAIGPKGVIVRWIH